ncbi:hypothetical protein E3J84_04740 [Candidatus Aerophobetes bacterium]|uniref:HhH-GPD domain-containing protein n=1 Tax=Aerophobetes bacterium TaxID=2030807 RepID=A0A523RVH3_UNCAE|nr:MAG: hypothetical protein E3J84_04740 [Candidatus Aerophobetes bacterium]
MERTKLVNILVKELGETYSKLLGINLLSGESEEIFKWFLASLLFGARISESITRKTYKEFEKKKVVLPRKIMDTGWDGLVAILDEGGYVRYDFKTATKLLEITGNLLKEYKGDLNTLHSKAKDTEDLEKRLINLGKGIGKVTVAIFLRELRGIWEKADPFPTILIVEAARNLGFAKENSSEKALRGLKSAWNRCEIKGKDFIQFETALLRLGKDWCRKKKCQQCSFSSNCQRF